MRKLYLLLTSNLILLTGVGTLTTTVAGCTKETVYDALKKFGEKNPIKIPFQGEKSTAKVSDETVTKAIKKEMQSKDPIFTSDVLEKIKFDDTLLKPNEQVAVKATYNKKETPIYVKEAENPIYKELAKFHKNNPLQIIYDTNNPKPKPSDPEAAENIRYGLKLNNKIIFTDEVTKKITFKGDHNLKIDEAILVNATYEKKQILMYVEEKLDIAPLISNELLNK